MAVSEEKLSELEEALAELGKDDDEVSAVLRRFEGGQRTDLAAVDQELEALADDVSIASIVPEASTVEAQDPQHPEFAQDDWEGESTEVEIIDPSDDFVLLVDDDDLEEFETVADRVPQVTVPPPLPGKRVAQAESEEDEEEEGFFKKLFGSRRSSNRP